MERVLSRKSKGIDILYESSTGRLTGVFRDSNLVYLVLDNSTTLSFTPEELVELVGDLLPVLQHLSPDLYKSLARLKELDVKKN